MPKLTNIVKTVSDSNPHFMRISGDVYFSKNDVHQTLWFEYPCSYDNYVGFKGDAWLIALLPCAFLENEDLTIDIPVDPVLLGNAHQILKIWSHWYHENEDVIKVVAPIYKVIDNREKSSSLIFFSGGVDSYFSLLRNLNLNEHFLNAMDVHLATVWGLDIPLSNKPGFSIARNIAELAAKKHNAKYIEVKTNLREFPAYLVNNKWYANLSFGAALASVGLLFSNGIKKIVIGSGSDYANLSAWGSHPMVDHLFGTSQTEVEHDGADFTRLEKTAYIFNDSDVAGNLRVCWSPSENCSRCSKCLRTMVTIDLLGHKDSCTSFDWSEYSLEKISNVYLEKDKDEVQFLQVLDGAVKRERRDIVNALSKSIDSSRFKRRFGIPGRVESAANTLNKIPLLWRYAKILRRLHGKLIGR